jgi:hypothetical protein
MEPDVSLSCLKQPATDPYPQADEAIHMFQHYFPKVHSNIILPTMLGLSSGIEILCAFLMSPMRTACSVHLIVLDLTTLIIFGEAYKL